MDPLTITSLIGLGKDLIGRIWEDPTQQAEQLRRLTELEQKQDLAELQAYISVLQGKMSIIQSEAKSEHWLTANWRPITALVLVFIVFNNYILYPYLSMFIDNAPVLDTPPDLWDLIKLCLSGYIASRGFEKGIKEWKK